MNIDKFIGKTLGELSRQTGLFWKPVRVFVLKDKDDDTGVLLMSAYSLRQVIHAHPQVTNATVVVAYKFYEETILRVLI